MPPLAKIRAAASFTLFIKKIGVTIRLQDHHQHSESLIHFLKQTIKSQRNENPQRPSEQLADNSESEQQLMRRNIVDRCSWTLHDQGVGNVDEAHDGHQ